GGGVSLWGFDARLRAGSRVLGRGGRVREWCAGDFGGSGWGRKGSVALRDLGFCGRRRRWVLPSAERGRRRRYIGVGQAQRWETAGGALGNELASPMEGTGENRGWRAGSKISTMIMRPPQQGHAFYPLSS